MQAIDSYAEGKPHLLEFSVALSLALGAGAVAAYQRFFSDAAQRCNHLSGNAKSICMTKYKLQIANSVVNDLKRKKADPQMIHTWSAKVSKYQAKLIRLQQLQKRK